ncbi:4-alpha-glucanotransferase DPE2 [Gracilariopsis chorda]|uniref:4-alpha-glucanotransferase n=1 Tax=Gracilariopsis chorda TaxID=448386 RepID=A0A2V3IHU1_9FLOR|nr:4-alpha-glucanotransferase DPE2 [Gracilariopsis chorda]|eukprot:PXF41675.1 4-alpha-glucanotransferase DPE2 [Gracilariopsis chorda]
MDALAFAAANGKRSATSSSSSSLPNGNARAPAASLTLRFCVTASTTPGQHVFLCLQNGQPTTTIDTRNAVSLSFESPGVWTAQVVRPVSLHSLKYKYFIKEHDLVVWESGSFRQLCISDYTLCERLLVRDVWRAAPDVSRELFATSAFTDVVFRRDKRQSKTQFEQMQTHAIHHSQQLTSPSFIVRFTAFAPRVQPGDQICVLGDCEQLANSNASRAIPLCDYHAPEWSVCVAFPADVTHINYRFVIRRDGIPLIEDSVHRVLQLNHEDKRFVTTSQSQPGAQNALPFICAPCETGFQFPTKWKGAGIALPVFSIRSTTSCGVGEFTDLPKVVDFCKKAGYQLLQLLPVNDTTANNTAKDSYPYSAVSSFALHPQYLNIDALGDLPPHLNSEYETTRKQLNELPEIDYVKVITAKLSFIKRMYTLQRDDFLKSRPFLDWFEQHQAWLVPYALFRFFMEINGSAKYDQWGARSSVTLEEMKKLASPHTFHFEYLALTYYTQYHLHKQLKAAADYAATHQVVFKGDLPIGVNRYCADTWVNPHLFRLHMQAGAPPDFFSVHGQNWFFPTYHWDAMKQDNYAWWRSRLGHMSNYFHAYRIDHILGFFRIWEIPDKYRTGMAGRFYPAYGVTRQELESLGLWDIERYTKPYITDGLLHEMFHEHWWKIKERFFEPIYDRLRFKEEYNTETKMVQALQLPSDAPETEREYGEFVLKQMVALFNNVCLLDDVGDPNVFHPRFKLHTTTSYMELPSEDWKRALHHLHDDYMYHRQDELWKKNGLERLPMMKSASQMLVCGEDLGLIPKCVPSVMKETCILSLAVQRMPDGDAEFGIPSEYKYECVATTSSHDTSTFRGWWEEMPADQRLRYWQEVMKQDGRNPPPTECQTEVCEWAIKDHLECPAMWTIFPLQDLLGIDTKLRRKNAAEEQINDPSNPSHIWRFRLHLNIEDLLKSEEFVKRLANMNKKANRGATY